MVQTSSWHKTEQGIIIVILLPLVKLIHFHVPNKGVTTEIIEISSAIAVCILCQVGAQICSRNYIIAP